MVIVYCESCGKRVPPPEIESRRAVQTGENLWLCASCAIAQNNPDALMPSTATMPVAQTPTSPNPRVKTGSHSSTGATVRRGSKTTAYEPPVINASKAKQFILGSAGAALLLGIVIFAFSGKKKEPEAVLATTKQESTPSKASTTTTPKSEPIPTTPSTKSETIDKSKEPPKSEPAKSVEPQKSSGGIIAGDPKSITTPAQPTVPLTPAERQKQMDKEMEEYRVNRAQRLLDEHKAWFKQNPNEAWDFKTRLNEVAGTYGSTPAGAEAKKLLEDLKNVAPPPDKMEANAPEMKEYQLVYDLNLANLGKNLKYDVDNRASITKPIDRIAYILELDDKYMFVSMDAFTTEVDKIGVPLIASDARFQQTVANLNVISNANGIINGTGISTGNIEFWSGNYGPANQANVAGASNDKFDFGDIFTDPKDGYGCMQVHNFGQAQTLLAINNFGAGGGGDIGIGNNTNGNPDWTFTGSGNQYRRKRLRVLVKLKP